MTLILAALDGELTTIRSALIKPEERDWRGLPVVCGSLPGTRGASTEVVVGRTGVGKVQAALLAQHLIDRHDPERIIMAGVAGSLRNDLDVGDAVIATATVQHDIDVTSLGFAPGAVPYTNYHVVACDPLMPSIASRLVRQARERIVTGIVASGDQFIDTPEVRARLARVYDAACVEMEGAAVGFVAHVNGVPFSLLRIISDHANGKAANFKEVLELAASRVWHYLSQMIPFGEESDRVTAQEE